MLYVHLIARRVHNASRQSDAGGDVLQALQIFVGQRDPLIGARPRAREDHELDADIDDGGRPAGGRIRGVGRG